MLYDLVLNKMDVDELRNYVSQFQELESLHGEISYMKDAIIEEYQNLVFDMQHLNDKLLRFKAKQEKIQKLIHELEEKYPPVLPTS